MDFIALLHHLHPISLLFANGEVFFWGTILAALTVMGERHVRGAFARAALRFIGLVGVACMLASSTPFPAWVYVCWCALWLAAFPRVRATRFLAPAFLFLSAVLCLLELPYHLSQRIPVSRDQQVYVVGDSISAGIDTPERNWPLVLGDIAHLKVSNLSVAGATASSALPQTDGITQANALVILEIGGNDLLDGIPSAKFSGDLERLLDRIPSSCRCVMFELPLIPFHGGYGQAQRALARKHKILLIPKRYMISVIGSADGTLEDGLHLSQKGHNALAANVFSMLSLR